MEDRTIGGGRTGARGAGPARDGQEDGGGDLPAAADVVVVGAGLAGLAAACRVARDGASVLVLDGGSTGGRARSAARAGGALLNMGPHALYVDGAGAAVLRGLGIDPPGGDPSTGTSAVLSGGTLHPLPDGPRRLITTSLLSWRERLAVARLLAGVGRIDPAALVGTPTAEWLVSAGLTGRAAALVGAVVRLGTYCADLDRLDAGAAVGQLQLALGGGVRYVHGGWRTIVDALVEAADGAGARIASRRRVEALHPDPAGGWLVGTSRGEVRAGSVVLAVGTPAAASRLAPASVPAPEPGPVPASVEATGERAATSGPAEVPGLGDPVTASCLDLVVRGPVDLPFLVDLDEPLYLSDHSAVARLAPPGTSVVHVLRYGATDPDLDRAQLWRHAAAAGIGADDVVDHRFLARMVVAGGAPLAATGGLHGRPPVAHPGRPGLFLAGDWVGPTGMLADAALASGAAAGDAAAGSTASGDAERGAAPHAPDPSEVVATPRRSVRMGT